MPKLISASISTKRRLFYLGIVTLLAACVLWLILILDEQGGRQPLTAQEQLEEQVETAYHQGMAVAEGKITIIDSSKSTLTVQSTGEDGTVKTTIVSTKDSQLVVFGKSYGSESTSVTASSLDKLKMNDQLVIYATKPAQPDSAVDATAIRVLVSPGSADDMPIKSGPKRGASQ